eukprot:TRINITY_DN341_c1_g2_i1.p1 TRINITY_DN341_c1_g2~~TRINITY_DN341_c1_g2_i1.p1  ORF type:complete len:1183 (-),score=232.23 TRINITY_DN341_c1_g2_i1:1564-5112(-)
MGCRVILFILAFVSLALSQSSDGTVLCTISASLSIAGWNCDLSNNPLSDPCLFPGVSCTSGSVTSINLKNSNISGYLPLAFLDLLSLTSLDLSDNQIVGRAPAFYRMPNLISLDLSGNPLYGCPAVEFGAYSNFSQCSFPTDCYSECQTFYGQISSVCTFPTTCNLSSTTTLLGYDQFCFSDHCQYGLPCPFTVCQDIPNYGLQVVSLNLTDIDLPSDVFDGDFSEYFFLECLVLEGLPLEGELPSTIFRLPLLRYLDVSRMPNMDGQVPASVPSFLYFLKLSEMGLYGTIPSTLFESNLEFVDLSYNFLEGSLPAFSSRLIYLNVEQNYLTGTLPAFPIESSLQVMRFNDNFIHGCFDWSTIASPLSNNVIFDTKTGEPLPTSDGSRNCLYVNCNSNYDNITYTTRIPVDFFPFNCEFMCNKNFSNDFTEPCLCEDGKVPKLVANSADDLQTCACDFGFEFSSDNQTCVEVEDCCQDPPETAICDLCDCMLANNCCSHFDWRWIAPPAANDTRFFGIDKAIDHAFRVWSQMLDFPSSNFKFTVELALKTFPRELASALAVTEVDQVPFPGADFVVPPAFRKYYYPDTTFNTTGPDFRITINANYLFDFRCGNSTEPNKYNLATVMMHEIAHGLLFFSEFNDNGTYDFYRTPDGKSLPGLYDLFVSYLDSAFYPQFVFENVSSYANVLALKSSSAYFVLPLYPDSSPYLNRGGSQFKYSDLIHLDELYYPSDSVNSLLTAILQRGQHRYYPGYYVLSIMNEIGYNIADKAFVCEGIDNEADCLSATFLKIENVCGWSVEKSPRCGPGDENPNSTCTVNIILFVKNLPRPTPSGFLIYYYDDYDTVEIPVASDKNYVIVSGVFRDGDELLWGFYDPITDEDYESDIIDIEGCSGGTYGLAYPVTTTPINVTLFSFVDCNNDGLYDNTQEPGLADQEFEVYQLTQDIYDIISDENGTVDYETVEALINDLGIDAVLSGVYSELFNSGTVDDSGKVTFNLSVAGIYVFVRTSTESSPVPTPSSWKKQAEKEVLDYEATFDEFVPELKNVIPGGGNDYYVLIYGPDFSYNPTFVFGMSPATRSTYIYYNCPQIAGLPVSAPVPTPIPLPGDVETNGGEPVAPSDFSLPPLDPVPVGAPATSDPPPINILCNSAKCPDIEVVFFKKNKVAAYSTSPCVGKYLNTYFV